MERYSFHIKLLQFYINLGVIVTKVHTIVDFSQKALFANFVEYCAERRKEATLADDEFRRKLYKSFPNQLYGKTLQNDLAYDGKNVLVSNGAHYRRKCSD